MKPEDFKKFIEETIDKILSEEGTSVTSAGEAYSGKKAYLEPQKTGQAAKYLEKKFGYTPAKKNKNSKIYDVVSFKEEQLNEISYRRFSESVNKVSPERKITRALSEVNKRVKEIEQVIEYSNRLKTENVIKRSNFWESKLEQLNELSTRLNQLSKNIKKLSNG